MYLYMKKAQESRTQVTGPSQLISKFDITFDRQSGSIAAGFLPGECILGELTYTLSVPTQPKGIKLQLIGSERVKWFEDKERSGKRFLTLNVLTKSLPGNQGKYKFKVNLPLQLPQSYNGKQGCIHYWIEPVFGEGILTAISSSTRHEGKMNTKQRNDFLKKYRKAIKVQPNFDLSAIPDLHKPLQAMKDNSGLFSTKNLIEVILALPKLGYVPNETIEFKVHIINGSDKDITSSTLTLIQEAKFCAGPVNTSDVKTLFEESGPQLPAKSCQIWHGKIKIPSKVSPISTRCSFINVDYYLKASVTSTGFMDTVEVKIPLVIGTVSTTGVDTNDSTSGLRATLSPSMESLASQVTFCSHGYLDRSRCDGVDCLPDYASLAAITATKVKTDDDWDTMSFSSLPAYSEVNTPGSDGPGEASGSSGRRPC